MNLDFTPEEKAFQAEVREFLDTALPDDLRQKFRNGELLTKEETVRWARILDEKGWGAPRWPKEFGGTGWTPAQRYIFNEELQAIPAAEPFLAGQSLVGPVLINFGTEDQQRRFLPRILNYEDWWAQGFSEPGAGSDLAAIATTARREGGFYVVNGQKTWTTLAQHANWIFCLVRTDPTAKKQKGISFLLMDMASPGITVRPIITIDGEHEVNEVFFDNVKVPVENLVGEENKGWDYAKFLLSNERSMGTAVGMAGAYLRLTREMAAKEMVGNVRLIDTVQFREKLTKAEVSLKALQIMQMRIVANESKHEKGKPDPYSSILKLGSSSLLQKSTELLMEAFGPRVLPFHQESEEGEMGPELASRAAPTYFNMRKVSIFGGSAEIQRNIIAKAFLGL